MAFDDRSSIGDEHMATHSPTYSLGSDLFTTLFVAAILMAATIGGMLLVADTILADLLLALYGWMPILGVLVMGGLISAGRYLGLQGIGDDSLVSSAVGVVLCVFAYAWFGGAVLHPYSPSLYVPALLITGGITILLTLIAGIYVYTRDGDFSHWTKYSGMCFLIGIVAALIGSFFSPLLLVTFIAFLLGFLCDLVYEIWMTSNKNRTPVRNGIALYVAFAGVFVHILQLVLKYLAKKN